MAKQRTKPARGTKKETTPTRGRKTSAKTEAPYGYTVKGTPRKRPLRPNEGMPPHKPTDAGRREVMAMAGYGIPHDDIALVLEIGRKTLEKYYRRELDIGHTMADRKVVERLWKNATEGDTTACIWWTKSRMRWTEKQAPQVIYLKRLEDMTDDELRYVLGDLDEQISDLEAGAVQGARPARGTR